MFAGWFLLATNPRAAWLAARLAHAPMNCGAKFGPNDKDGYPFVNKLIRLIVLRFRHQSETTMDPLPLRALLVFDAGAAAAGYSRRRGAPASLAGRVAAAPVATGLNADLTTTLAFCASNTRRFTWKKS